MIIKILEKDSNKRGLLFEKFANIILSKFGYIEIKLRPLMPGYEIDFEAGVGIGRGSVIGECKARQKLIDSSVLQKFFVKFYVKRRDNPHVMGVLLTLSDLSSGAVAFLKELKKESHLQFEVIGPTDIANKLVKSGFMASQEFVKRKISDLLDKIMPVHMLLPEEPVEIESDKISKNYNKEQRYLSDINSYTLDDIYLTITNNNRWFWVQLVSSSDQEKYFFVADEKGRLMRNPCTLEYIRNQDDYLRDNSIKPFPYGLDINIDSLAALLAKISGSPADRLCCDFLSILLRQECYDGLYAILTEIQAKTYPPDLRPFIVDKKKEMAESILLQFNIRELVGNGWARKIMLLYEMIAYSFVIFDKSMPK